MFDWYVYGLIAPEQALFFCGGGWLWLEWFLAMFGENWSSRFKDHQLAKHFKSKAKTSEVKQNMVNLQHY